MINLRDVAAAELIEAGVAAPSIAEVDRWERRLVAVGRIPDEVLAAMPEISRHDEPQISPQQYECGCVAVTRITDRNGCSWLGPLEAPFEMRLALPCQGGPRCELSHLRVRPELP